MCVLHIPEHKNEQGRRRVLCLGQIYGPLVSSFYTLLYIFRNFWIGQDSVNEHGNEGKKKGKKAMRKFEAVK